VRVLVAYRPNKKAGFSKFQQAQRKRLESQILKQAPRTADSSIAATQVSGTSQLLSEMRKRRLDRALLWTLSGHRKTTASLLWQGMTHLTSAWSPTNCGRGGSCCSTSSCSPPLRPHDDLLEERSSAGKTQRLQFFVDIWCILL
jgi:hypothetical protein